MHLAEVILLAREDGFTHIQIGEGRLSLKNLPRAFSGGGEYLYRFAPEPHLCLLTPFGSQLYPLLALHKGAEVNRIMTPDSENTEQKSAEEKPKTLTYIGRNGRERGLLKQTPWMFD
jgi:hypothetical protein